MTDCASVHNFTSSITLVQRNNCVSFSLIQIDTECTRAIVFLLTSPTLMSPKANFEISSFIYIERLSRWRLSVNAVPVPVRS